MTPEIPKTVKDRWIEIGVFILTVIGFVLDHWELAGSRVSAIWEHVWPIIAAYGTFRLFQFGSRFYQRFTELEAQVQEDKKLQEERSNTVTRLEAVVKSHRDKYDEMVKSQQQEIQKLQESLVQVDKKLKGLEEVLRHEIKERMKLEAKVIELENKLYPEKNRQAKRERLVELLTAQQTPAKNPPIKGSLADILPSGLLSLAARGTPVDTTPTGVLNRAAPTSDPPLTGRPPVPAPHEL